MGMARRISFGTTAQPAKPKSGIWMDIGLVIGEPCWDWTAMLPSSDRHSASLGWGNLGSSTPATPAVCSREWSHSSSRSGNLTCSSTSGSGHYSRSGSITSAVEITAIVHSMYCSMIQRRGTPHNYEMANLRTCKRITPHFQKPILWTGRSWLDRVVPFWADVCKLYVQILHRRCRNGAPLLVEKVNQLGVHP